MTVREILEKVSFEDLLEPLKNIEERTEDNLYSYKQTFDLLRMLELKPSDGEVVNICWELDDCDNPPYLSACYHVRTDWEIMLSRQVEISEEHKGIRIEEAAAILLWEITYWGYSQEQEMENLDEKIGEIHMDGNPYVASYEKLGQRHHDLNCRYQEDIGTKYYSLKDGFEDLFGWKPKRNVPKRHRERRQTKRLESLESKMKRWDLQAKLLSKSQLEGEDATLLQKEVMNSHSLKHYVLMSRANEGEEISYLEELVREYFPQKTGSRAIVLFSGPQRIIEDPYLDKVWKNLYDTGKIPFQAVQMLSVNELATGLCVDILVFE